MNAPSPGDTFLNLELDLGESSVYAPRMLVRSEVRQRRLPYF